MRESRWHGCSLKVPLFVGVVFRAWEIHGCRKQSHLIFSSFLSAFIFRIFRRFIAKHEEEWNAVSIFFLLSFPLPHVQLTLHIARLYTNLNERIYLFVCVRIYVSSHDQWRQRIFSFYSRFYCRSKWVAIYNSRIEIYDCLSPILISMWRFS